MAVGIDRIESIMLQMPVDWVKLSAKKQIGIGELEWDARWILV